MKADFAQMDKALQDRLSDIVKMLQKQFADKADTRKALKIHEKQFQNLYNLIMSKGSGDNEEDAMFSKKPFAGLSCASCEKDITNMIGRRVEYMPWGKLPMRDPNDRIARVGQGFSKMLSLIKPESMTELPGSRNSPELLRNSNQLPSVIRESRQAYDPEEFHRLSKSKLSK